MAVHCLWSRSAILDPPKGPHYSSQTTPVPPSRCPTYVSPPNSKTHPTYQSTALYMKPESPRWKDLNLEDSLGQDNAGIGNEKKKGGLKAQTPRARLAIKPIGQDGWDTVVKLYMKWAKEKGYTTCDRTSLRQKFDRTVKSAKSKPTGATKRDKSTVFGLALECSSLIEDKSGCAVFMDSEGEDDEPNDNDIALESDEDVIATTEDGDSHAVDLTEDIDDETEITPDSPPSRKNKKAIIKTDENSGGIVCVKKEYHAEDMNMPDVPTRGHRGGVQATDMLAAISFYFKPVAVQQHDDIHGMQALYVLQLQLLQNENSKLRKRVETLTD
ncbi:hypothetical protein BDQ17DRAFT_1328880 [Cyathus striatus]|nr:hypothetical protein BDQ17DRAFT_1328880 [Cyathus striatus]